MHFTAPLNRRLLTEVLATMMLVVFGCGSIVINYDGTNVLGLVGISLAWMYVVTTLIYTFGNISGTQMNPAITLALWSIGAMPRREVLPYCLAQTVGSLAGSAVLLWWFGNVGTPVPLGGTAVAPGLHPLTAASQEFLTTFYLMATAMGAGLDTRTPRGFAPLAIGMGAAVAGFVIGPLTGSSLNPIRSFGPAFIAWAAGAGTHVWAYHWVYWVGPPLGAVCAAQTLTYLRGDISSAVRQKSTDKRPAALSSSNLGQPLLDLGQTAGAMV